MRYLKYTILCLFIISSIITTIVEARFIQPFIIHIGGQLSSGDETTLAKFDYMLAQKNDWDDIDGDTWGAIKALNGGAGYAAVTYILPYEKAFWSDSAQDAWDVEATNDITRWDNARSHPSGDLSNDNPDCLLKDSGDDLIPHQSVSTAYAVDFGTTACRNYIIKAYDDDFIGQDWVADGVYSDNNTVAYADGTKPSPYTAYPALYSTASTFNTAQSGGLNAVTAGLTSISQKFATNRGNSRWATGKAAWLELDALATPPDSVLEEGAFVVPWGAEAWFYTQSQWLSQLETLVAIENSNVLFASRVVADDENDTTITDNFGQTITFRDAMWYAMGSFALGKKSNSYFTFSYDGSYQEVDLYWSEYAYIDLGDAIGTYYTKSVDGKAIYLRKFDLGYVIVNSADYGTSDLTNVSYVDDLDIVGVAREITHANMSGDWNAIGTSTQFATFNDHKAKILYVENRAVYSVSPTDGGAGIAVDASATWAYTDNVDDVELWLDTGACDGTPDDGDLDCINTDDCVGDESSGDAGFTYDMSTLAEATTYCLTLQTNYGAEQGDWQQFEFTTTTGPPAPPAGLAIGVYSSSGLTGVYDDQGATVGE